ncbi:hypothetical protein WA026_000056 [Henosepilachna vigintioctopunctata]|uniref:Transcriptional regulator ATRX n=1 Tax=Henosepilachna vigintioctopunctata TaxID=420089 RepID=A0AAW1UZ72_9CUCU
MEVDSVTLAPYISELLEKIYYLAEASQKRCHVLSDVDNIIIKCKRTLRLCNRIKKNCEYFENELVKESSKYGLELETQELNSSLCESDVSYGNVTTKSTDHGQVDSSQDKHLNNGLTISLKCGDIAKTRNISEVSDIDADKFWSDLIQYAENSLRSYQNQGKRVSPSKETESVSQKATGEDDQLLQQIREIFGSDSEADKDEGTPTLPSNEGQINIDKTHKDNALKEKSIDNSQVEPTSSQKEEHTKEGGKTSDGVTDKDILVKDVAEQPDQQIQNEKDNQGLKENTSKPSGQQIEVGNETSIGKDLNNTSQEMKDSEKDKDDVNQNTADNTCDTSPSEQSTNHIIESNKTAENEVTTETIDTRANEEKDKTKGSLCVPQITESIEEDIVSMLIEDSDNEQSPEETSEKQIPRGVPDDEILNKDEKSESVDSTLTAGAVSSLKTVEPSAENSLENTVHKDNTKLSPECPKQVVSLEELDVEATQIVVTRNSDDESAASQDTQATQICTVEAREIDADFAVDRNNFMAALGLSSANVEDSLMDVVAEVPHSKENKEGSESEEDERREYADEEVDAALKFIQQLDSSSDSCSVMSDGSDYLQFSDESNDSIHSASDSISQNGTRNSEKSTLSNSEQKQEKKASSEAASSNVDNSITKFKPKDCVVNIDRVDILNLQKKYHADAIKAREEFLKQKYSLKDCFVKLEHPRFLQVSDTDEEINFSSSNDDDEINRLCNLSSLARKRKIGEDSEDLEKKIKKKLTRIKRRRILDLSGSDTCDMSGFSSVSDSELTERKDKEDFENKVPTVLDPNELLTEIVCHTIHDSDSSSSDQESNEDVKRKKSMNKTTSAKKDEDSTSKKTWRDDPLLKGSLSLPSDTKKDSFTTLKRRRKINRILSSGSDSDGTTSDSDGTTKKAKKSKILDPTWQSDEDSSTSSSGDDFEPKPYIDFLRNTKMKGLTSDDSDVAVVNDGSASKAPVISLDSDEERDKKPGRRNILSVLSSAELTRETRKAAREEEERVLKLQKRDQIRNTQSQESTEDSLVLDSSDSYSLTVDPVLSKRLFTHQVAGVKFMWDACYLSLDSLETFEGTGCILAHNMGLGKTFQVFTLVHTLFSHSITNTKHVLIVCPLSTVAGWSKEFKSGLKLASSKTQINVICIKSSDDPDAKFACVNKWKQKGGVMIVGYEAFQKLTSSKRMNELKGEFLRKALVDPGPDLVICDEGHLLKNGKALRTKALMQIRTKRRIALTGTPLQNNLTEYYFMVQFVKPNLLGTYHEFRRQFVNPIMNGQYEDSDDADITLMKKRTHVLHRLLKNTVQRYEVSELQKYLGNMKDYALFIELHPVQKELYKEYMAMAVDRKNPKTTKKIKFFFTDFELARFICSHPQLLYTMETQNTQVKKKIKEQDIICEEPEVQEVEGIPDGWWKSKCSEEVKTNLEFGTKLKVMMGIIEEAENIEEKVLIFTSSLVELSSIEYFLKLKGTPSCPSWKPRRDYFRMDGTVPPSVRTQMCDMFNDTKNKKLRVFLMSHKVGGLGLNLVAASRVILLGANFNPSYDTQSIFRAYRFGQEKCVYIYRLISMGTMEQKIYQRCVSKLAIASRVVDKHQIARHFKNLDLDDLYQVAVDLPCERSMPAKPDDNLLSKILLKFECIYKYHQHQKLLENRPNEDLNEEDKMKAWEEFKQITEPPPPPPPPPPVNEIGNPSNASSVLLPDQAVAVSDILYSRYLQLNQNRTPNQHVGPVLDAPLGIATHMQMEALNLSASSSNFMHRPGVLGGNSRNLVPNPAILRVNRDTNSMNNAPSLNDKLVNVDSSPMAKKKSSILAPNPFVLGNINNRKENVTNTKGGLMPFRKSSSDDFQKSSQLKYPRLNTTSRHHQTPGTWTSTARAPDNVHIASRNSGSAMMSSARDVKQINTSITVDDDDVMVVDVPQNEESEESLQNRIEQLSTNGLTVSYASKSVQKNVPTAMDTSIIEIL